MADRPEYVHCVAHEPRTRARYGAKLDNKPVPDNLARVSWCGRVMACEFHYVDAAHALNTAYAEGYPMICPECSDAISKVLKPQTWRADED